MQQRIADAQKFIENLLTQNLASPPMPPRPDEIEARLYGHLLRMPIKEFRKQIAFYDKMSAKCRRYFFAERLRIQLSDSITAHNILRMLEAYEKAQDANNTTLANMIEECMPQQTREILFYPEKRDALKVERNRMDVLMHEIFTANQDGSSFEFAEFWPSTSEGSPLVEFYNSCIRKDQEERGIPDRAKYLKLIENLTAVNQRKARVAAVREVKSATDIKVLSLDADNGLLGFFSSGIFFSRDPQMLLKNIKNPDELKKMILSWIDDGGVVAFATQGFSWDFVSIRHYDKINLPLCSGAELIELHLQALLGDDYARVKSKIMIEAFAAFDRKESFAARTFFVNEEQEAKLQVMAQTLYAVYPETADHKQIETSNNDILDAFEAAIKAAGYPERTERQSNVPPGKIQHHLNLIAKCEKMFPGARISLTCVDSERAQLVFASTLLKDQVHSLTTVCTKDELNWRTRLVPKAPAPASAPAPEAKAPAPLLPAWASLSFADEKKDGAPADSTRKLFGVFGAGIPAPTPPPTPPSMESKYNTVVMSESQRHAAFMKQVDAQKSVLTKKQMLENYLMIHPQYRRDETLQNMLTEFEIIFSDMREQERRKRMAEEDALLEIYSDPRAPGLGLGPI